MKTRSRFLFGLAVAILAPALYLGSFIPMIYVMKHGYIPDLEDTFAGDVFNAYSMPLRYVYFHGPEPVQRSMDGYAKFLDTL